MTMTSIDAALAELNRPRGRIWWVEWREDEQIVWQYFTRGDDAARRADAEAFAARMRAQGVSANYRPAGPGAVRLRWPGRVMRDAGDVGGGARVMRDAVALGGGAVDCRGDSSERR